MPHRSSVKSSVYIYCMLFTHTHPHIHTHTHTHCQSWRDTSSDDLSVLSVEGGEREGGATSNADVFYISQQYSLVFVLDLTPTMIQVV